MHVSGIPCRLPSTSQNGKAGSEHTPSAHDRGLGFVHAIDITSESAQTPRIRRFCVNMRVLVDRDPPWLRKKRAGSRRLVVLMEQEGSYWKRCWYSASSLFRPTW